VQFLFKSTHQSWRYERKCEWVFFSEHSVYCILQSSNVIHASGNMLSSVIHNAAE